MALHLVTGGSGFVGSNIGRLLRERGEQVRVLDIWRDDAMAEGVEYIEADINDAEKVARAMAGVDYVHHNVALVPLAKAGERFWTVNVEGTRTALKAAVDAKVKMFAHMSSSAIFGSPTVMPITNETPLHPIEIYGRAKLAGEELARQAGKEGLPVSIIRPRTIVGTGRLGIFEILFDWIKDNANIYVIGSGEHLFQFVHVDDLSLVSVESCLQEKPGVYNVGAEKFGTLKQDLGALIAHAGKKGRVKSLPAGPAIFALTVLDKTGLSPLGPWHYLTYHKPFYFDIKPTMERLNWRPKYSNQEILNNAYDWFTANFDKHAKADASASFHKKPVRQGVLKLIKAMA